MPKTPENTYYYVTLVKDHEGCVTFGAYTAKQLKERVAELSDDYKEALKGWYSARKEAQKIGEKFDEPKPTTPKRKSIKVKGKEKADALVAKLQAKWEERQAKKEAESLGEDEPQDDETPKKSKGDQNKASREKPKARG